jgi:hypothetical protein
MNLSKTGLEKGSVGGKRLKRIRVSVTLKRKRKQQQSMGIRYLPPSTMEIH